jgi:sulfoxide reductase heme-binding subunit YedZ
MLAFATLVPLAATSNAPMIRRLGGRRWQALHRLAYLAAAAAALHFIMLVKSWPAEPIVYAAIVAALLLFRLQHALRKRLRPEPATSLSPRRAS